MPPKKKGKGGKGGGGGGDEPAVVELDIPEGTPTGCVSVSVASAELPSEGLAEFLGEANADPLKCWARCHFRRGDEADTRFWPPALQLSGEGSPTWTMAAEATLSERSGSHLVTFQYPSAVAAPEDAAATESKADAGPPPGATLSRPVPLAALPDAESGEVPSGAGAGDRYLLELLQSTVVVELFVGDERDPGADLLVATGTLPIPLASMQSLTGVEHEVSLTWSTDPEDGDRPAPPATAPTVTVSLSPDEAMEERCRGGRVVTIELGTVEATAVPSAWAHPFTWAELQDETLGEAWKSTVFDLRLGIALRGGGEGDLAQGTVFAGGKVAPPTEPPPPEEGSKTEEDTGEDGGTEVAGDGDGGAEGGASGPTAVAPSEIVAWQDGKGPSLVLFLARDAVRGLRRCLTGAAGDGDSRGKCAVTLTRYHEGYPPEPRAEGEGDGATDAGADGGEEEGVEAPAPPPAPDVFEGVVDLSSLLQPEVTSAGCESCALSNTAAEDGGADRGYESKVGGGGAEGAAGGGGEGEEEDGEYIPTRPFVAAASGVALRGVRVKLDQGLVKMPPPPPAPSLAPSDLIPPRAPVEKKPFGKDAAAMLRDEVRAITDAVADELNSMAGGAAEDGGGETKEDKRRVLLHRLNTSGRYYEFRERLKRAVVRLVREKFSKDGQFAVGSPEFDLMAAKLYVHLMDQVQSSLVATFEEADDRAFPFRPDDPMARKVQEMKRKQMEELEREKSPPEMLEARAALDKLRVLALEADYNGALDIAEQRHQDRVNVLEDALRKWGSDAPLVDPAHGGAAGPWYDYACLCCSRGDVPRAAEALKEAIAIDQAHAPSLTLYAAIQLTKDELTEACVLVEAAVKSARAAGEAGTAAAAEAEAMAGLILHFAGTHPAAPSCVPAPPRAEGCLDAGDFVVRHGLADLGINAAAAALACAAAAKEDADDLPVGSVDAASPDAPRILLSRGERMKHALLVAQTSTLAGPEGHVEAERVLEEAVDLDTSCARGWCLLGHLRCTAGSPVYSARGARLAYQTALRSYDGHPAEAQDPRLALRYAGLCLSAGGDALDTAEEMYLRACQAFPTSSSWMGVGVALLRKNQLAEAEEALSEANIRDNRNPTVWGWLSLLCMICQPQRNVEADQAFDQAVLHGITEPALLVEIGSAFVERGKLALAEAAFRRSLQREADPPKHLMLAKALVAQHNYEEAVTHYRAAANSATPGSETANEAAEGIDAMAKKLGYGTVRAKGRF